MGEESCGGYKINRNSIGLKKTLTGKLIETPRTLKESNLNALLVFYSFLNA